MKENGRFIELNGPVYLRVRDGETQITTYVTEHQSNPLGLAHGGWLATLMDITLPQLRLAAPKSGAGGATDRKPFD